MKALLVHNPTAGDGATGREALLDLLHKAGITPAYQSSKVGSLTAALAEPTDIIVAAGGDGTVTKVLTQMPDRSVPVGILPIGTANNIASSFGISGPLGEIAAGLGDAGKRRLDIGLARGPWGCCWVVEGIGVGALVRAAARVGSPSGSRASRLDAARRAVRRILKKAKPDRLRIMLDGRPLPEEHLMVEVLNIAWGGPGLLLAPDVDPGDGYLDVIMLEPHQRKEMRRWLSVKPPAGLAPMSRWRGRTVSLVWDGTPLHIDDEQPAVEEGAVELQLVTDSATILVPQLSGH
ncbi:MAG: diacylglycerol/lipid kinase family protein [Pseudomonadales bacterium]